MTTLTEDMINELLEDRKNGMGLQKTAKKYGIGVARLRKIEKEKGLEVAIPSEDPLLVEDIKSHIRLLPKLFTELQKQGKILENLALRPLSERGAERDNINELEDKVEELPGLIENVNNTIQKWGFWIGGISLVIAFINIRMPHLMWAKVYASNRGNARQTAKEF